MNIAIYYYNHRHSLFLQQKRGIKNFLAPYDLSNSTMSFYIDSSTSNRLMLDTMVYNCIKYDFILVYCRHFISIDEDKYNIYKEFVESTDCILLETQDNLSGKILINKIAGA